MEPIVQLAMSPSPPPLAQHAMLDGVVLAVVGVALVFAALILIWVAIELITRTMVGPPEPAAVAESAPDSADVAPDGLDGRTLAILSAAAIAAAGPRARIRHIQRLEHDSTSIWTAHGRIAVQSSHRFRRAGQ